MVYRKQENSQRLNHSGLPIPQSFHQQETQIKMQSSKKIPHHSTVGQDFLGNELPQADQSADAAVEGLEQTPKASGKAGASATGGAESGAVADDFTYLKARWPELKDGDVDELVVVIRSRLNSTNRRERPS